MKVIAKPVEMMAWSDTKGHLMPIKFKLDCMMITIDKVIEAKEEMLAGNKMLVYTCRSQERIFELKYEIKSCKWMLSSVYMRSTPAI